MVDIQREYLDVRRFDTYEDYCETRSKYGLHVISKSLFEDLHFLKERNEMSKQQWIMVMSKAPHQKEFGMNRSWSVTRLGAKTAMEKAQAYLEYQSKTFREFKFILQGGEW